MNTKAVVIIFVAMVALTTGQYDRYSRGNKWESGGLGGSWDRLSLGGSRLGIGNNWGLRGVSIGQHGRYRRAAVGYGRYGQYDNGVLGSRWNNRLGGHLGGPWRRSGLGNLWRGY